ncbi:MAG TPA: protein kinase [Polyangiaceae bacterium]
MKKAGHEELVGRTIAGKYVVEGLIGTGAMGAVFRARQMALEKTVAIKVMHGEHASDPAFAARFHREAKAASRLNHPNSIQILDFGAEADGLLYIAMEYLDGRSLHALLRDEWPLAPARVANIAMQTLAALAVAHDTGVVHRDLKPENVMVLSGTDDDGRPKDIVKVCDFGIAKITDPRAYRTPGERESDGPVTTAGFLVGTPEYMSPEQGRGEKLDPRSDLYSVGVILFEMLTKRVPFDAENAIGIVLKHITEEPQSPSKLVSGVDPRLEAVTLRALKKFREERFASAREMRSELRPIAEGVGLSTPASPPVDGLAPTIEPPSLVNAATVAMPVPAASSYGTGAKPTLEGTTAVVTRLPRRRRGLVAAGSMALLFLVAASGRALMSGHRQPAAQTVALKPAGAVAPSIPPDPAPTSPPVAPPREDDELPSSLQHTASNAHASPRAKAAGPTAPVASAAKSSASATPLSPAAASVVPVSPVPGAPPSGPTVSTPSATPAEATPPSSGPVARAGQGDSPVPDPGFDPAQAYVEVGMINAEGVKEHAVRGALHNLAFAPCYRSSLRAKGSRAPGVATLNLSFDETGLARSAVVTGADFLPGLARCVQEAASGMRIPSTQVDSGGGVAEVTLGFREP